jgi:hypothetical protein
LHTEEASGGRSVDDAAELLLAEDGPRRLRASKRALEMYGDDRVELGIRHVLEPIMYSVSTAHHCRGRSYERDSPLVAQDPRVVDQNRNTAESIERSLNDACAVGDGVVVDDSLAARYAPGHSAVRAPNTREARTAHDLINNLLCRIFVEVVYHYIRAACCIRERVSVHAQAVEGISLRVAYSVDARLSEATTCASDHDGVSSE